MLFSVVLEVFLVSLYSYGTEVKVCKGSVNLFLKFFRLGLINPAEYMALLDVLLTVHLVNFAGFMREQKKRNVTLLKKKGKK